MGVINSPMIKTPMGIIKIGNAFRVFLMFILGIA